MCLLGIIFDVLRTTCNKSCIKFANFFLWTVNISYINQKQAKKGQQFQIFIII